MLCVGKGGRSASTHSFSSRLWLLVPEIFEKEPMGTTMWLENVTSRRFARMVSSMAK